MAVVYRLAGLACYCATCARKCRRSRCVQAPSARMYHTNYKLIKSFTAFGRLRVVFMCAGPRTWNHWWRWVARWSSPDANRAIYVVVKQIEAAFFEGCLRGWRLHADYRDRRASVFYGGNVLRSYCLRLSIDLMSGCSGCPCPRRIYSDKLWPTLGIAMRILIFFRSSFIALQTSISNLHFNSIASCQAK